MLARDPKQWVELFAKYNSGTYNNQVGERRERDVVDGGGPERLRQAREPAVDH